MLSSIRKMYEIYYFMKKITLIIMEGAQFDQSNGALWCGGGFFGLVWFEGGRFSI